MADRDKLALLVQKPCICFRAYTLYICVIWGSCPEVPLPLNPVSYIWGHHSYSAGYHNYGAPAIFLSFFRHCSLINARYVMAKPGFM